MTDIEKAYLAGIFDSRCYLGVRPRSGRLEPQLEIGRAKPVLDRIQRIIGAGQIQPYKTGYRYRLRGARVLIIMAQIGEMMSSEMRYATTARYDPGKTYIAKNAVGPDASWVTGQPLPADFVEWKDVKMP